MPKSRSENGIQIGPEIRKPPLDFDEEGGRIKMQLGGLR